MRPPVIFVIFVTVVAAQQDFNIFSDSKWKDHYAQKLRDIRFLEEDNYEFLRNYTKWTEHFDKALIIGVVSAACSQQLQELNRSRDVLWNFFDSTSKWPWSGLSRASTFDWGNYDQCIYINHDYDNGTIKGKYCVYGLLIPIDFTNIDVNNLSTDDFYKLAVCMPDACTADDFNSLFKLHLFQDSICHIKEDLENFTWGEITMIIVLCIFGGLMILSTVYDIYIKRKQKKSAHPVLLAFSVYTNGKKILQTSKGNREQIQIFNGMKSISMAWIIAGHGMVGWNNFAIINQHSYDERTTDVRSAYIGGAQLSVDTFFYMGGFLLAYIYMKQKTKPLIAQIFSIPYMVIHRYIRLTPAVAMMYLVLITVFRHLGTGPIWDYGYELVTKPCHKYWYSFYSYTQNYVNWDDPCLIHTWYLSADMQMFIATTLLLIPLSVLLAKNPKNLRLVMGICIAINVFFIVLPLTTKLIWTDYANTYDTHSRMINYTMGLMMGIFMRETKDKPFFLKKMKNVSFVNLIIWICTLIVMGVTIVTYQYIIYSEKFSHTAQSLCWSFARPIWCIGLSWMVYSSYHGYGGIVNWILTRPTLQITAKLSYCMYLMHGLVVVHSTLMTRTRLYFSDWACFQNWCAYFIVTFVVAFVWSLAFESPLLTIEKIIFGGGAPKKHHKDKNIQKAEEHKQQEEQYNKKENV